MNARPTDVKHLGALSNFKETTAKDNRIGADAQGEGGRKGIEKT